MDEYKTVNMSLSDDDDKRKGKKKNLPAPYRKGVYIKQPYPISAMQADLSRQQIRIMVGMMQAVQDGVQKMFERGERNSDGQMLLFPDMQDDYVHIDFKFNDVVDRPDAYRHVEEIANKFMHMVFRYEDKNRGEVTLTHFVEKVSYPSRGSKRNKIRFSFTREQAQSVFNFTMYSRYLQPVAFAAENKYTARLYMLITSARGFDKEHKGEFHWFVGYTELRRILGCDEQDEKGRWYRKTQKQYKHFKADVLKAAQKELEQLAEEGKSDCWFVFTELPEEREGEPERFDFTVYLSAMGKIEDLRAQNTAKMNSLADFIQEKWSVDANVACSMMQDVDPQKFDEFDGEVRKLAGYMEEKADEIKDPHGYALAALKNLCESFTDNTSKNADEMQEEEVVMQETRGEVRGTANTAPEGWEKVVADMLRDCDTEQERVLMRSYMGDAFKKVEVTDKGLVVTVESQSFAKMFVKKYGEWFKRVLHEHMGLTEFYMKVQM